jgi:hypothetical protein
MLYARDVAAQVAHFLRNGRFAADGGARSGGRVGADDARC